MIKTNERTNGDVQKNSVDVLKHDRPLGIGVAYLYNPKKKERTRSGMVDQRFFLWFIFSLPCGKPRPRFVVHLPIVDLLCSHATEDHRRDCPGFYVHKHTHTHTQALENEWNWT